MKYVKSEKYNDAKFLNRIMGPNTIKLTEELMLNNEIAKGSNVLDLGSGMGVSSVFLANEYGFSVTACDLWSEAQENQMFFDEVVKQGSVKAVKADALALPFENECFDAVVSVDSYNYFGRNDKYLDEHLMPYVKKDGLVYISVTGMNKDLHDNLPDELLLSWSAEQLDYIHDMDYYKSIMEKSKSAKIVDIKVMQSNNEVWEDWLKMDNEYAKNDEKSIRAGALKYLNFIKIVLQKK